MSATITERDEAQRMAMHALQRALHELQLCVKQANTADIKVDIGVAHTEQRHGSGTVQVTREWRELYMSDDGLAIRCRRTDLLTPPPPTPTVVDEGRSPDL